MRERGRERGGRAFLNPSSFPTAGASCRLLAPARPSIFRGAIVIHRSGGSRSMTRHRVIFVLSLVLALGAAGLSGAQRPAHPPATYVVQNAKVVTEPGKELAKASVLIRDGRVEAVGENVTVPPGATVLDG